MASNFAYYLLPPILFVFGLAGNTMALRVLLRKNLKKIGPVLIYNLLFISDTIYLGIFFFCSLAVNDSLVKFKKFGI